jgi:hypothetical protein
MKKIRIALLASLVCLFVVSCDKQEADTPLYSANRFRVEAPQFLDENGQKVYLHYTDMASSLIYEEGDKVYINGHSFTLVQDGGWCAVSDDGNPISGKRFLVAYADGDVNNFDSAAGTYHYNLNANLGEAQHNKIVLGGVAENNGDYVITLQPACAILRLNTRGAGASYNYVKVGFDANKIPKQGTINVTNRTLSAGSNTNYLTGVTSDGGQFLNMRYSNPSTTGEDDYWYVAIPIEGSSVTTTLYLEWNNGSTTTKYRTQGQVTLQKGYVYTVGTTRVTPFTAEGYTNSLFYVNDSRNFVAFSAGNLQGQRYVSGLSQRNKWQFAPSQVTALKDANASIGLGVWVDLLGYGTSGYNSKHPNMSATAPNQYVNGDIAGTDYDWGEFNYANPGIIYGATTVNDVPWSTLTKAEWEYLIGRSNKAGLATITIDAQSYKGLVLLPDLTGTGSNWSLPEGASFTAGFSSYSLNNYSSSQWSTLENAGAVFLPVTNYRNGNNVTGIDEGYYWTSTGNNAGSSWALKIAAGDVNVVAKTLSHGCAVRLVARAES